MTRAKNCPPIRERFYAKTRRDDSGCLIWTAATMTGARLPYGSFTVDGRTTLAHRTAWELEVGPIPAGYQIDHLCKTTLCVDVKHLEPVPPRVNWARSSSPTTLHAMKTHCPQGHPYSDENTYRAGGRRYCRECRRAADHRRRARPCATVRALDGAESGHG